MPAPLDLSRSRVLVTGGAGFIGSNFVHRLLARHPGAHVVVLDALTYAGRRENLEGLPASSLTFVHGDIRDPAAVAAAMQGCQFVLNFAAESHVDRSIETPGEFIQTDVYGVFVLAEEARRVGVKRFVQVSTDEVYGEVLEAAARFVQAEGRFDHDTQRLLVGLGRTVCDRWQEPDEGIWEVRSGRFHHTHSKVLCWVALDRLLRLHALRHLDVPVARFRQTAEAIRAAVESEGWNERLGSYTATFGGDTVDASLLVLPLYRYVPATAPRMRSTLAHVLATLGRGEALLYRYLTHRLDDGLPPGEGCFGIASFMAVDCLARAGEVEHAARRFERLLAYANDVGLYAEEIDPETGAALGNFPQAFTHVGLINAAFTLAAARGEDVVPGRRSAGGAVAV